MRRPRRTFPLPATGQRWSKTFDRLNRVVTETDPVVAQSKAQSLRSPSIKIKLDSGSIVEVAVTQTNGIAIGQTVNVVEMVMPWGQIWYKLKGE